jgi:amino acid adenylation domain-containing protein
VTSPDLRRVLLELLINGADAQAEPALPAPLPPARRLEPVSHAQRRLWFLEQLQDDRTPYALHAIRRIRGPLDPDVLQRAMGTIGRRHEVLRTVFTLQDDEPMQAIIPDLGPVVETTDLSVLPPSEREGEAMLRMSDETARRFDLETGPLLRVRLYQLGRDDWLFLFVVHHIIFDGPSFAIFFAELDFLVRGGNPAGLRPIERQYADFARRERDALSPERKEAALAFWRHELAGLPLLDLPLDRPRQAVPAFRGAMRPLHLSAELTARLQRRAADRSATLFMVLLAGFAATLSRLCRQDDFAIGLPVTGRDDAAAQHAIGFFVDTLVLRCQLAGDPTADELIDRVKQALARALAHRELPFEMVVEALTPTRDLAVNPFFQVGFQLSHEPALANFDDQAGVARSSAMFDLSIDLWRTDNGTGGRIEFNTDLFEISTIELVATVFEHMLAALCEPRAHLGTFDLLPPGSPLMPSIIEARPVAATSRSCLEMIAEQAAVRPDAMALRDATDRYTYAELMRTVQRQAAILRRSEAVSGTLVAYALPRSARLICLQLAAWQAGAAFLYIDPAWPPERRRQVLEIARPAFTITMPDDATCDSAEDRGVFGMPQPGDTAYTIFTSGSTGVPKGVPLRHESLANVALVQQRLFEVGPGRRVGQLASPSFDASVFETVLALCSGATLIVAPHGPLSGEDLTQFIAAEAIDTVVLPPTLLASLEPGDVRTLRLVCTAGEACPADLAARWAERVELWNLYGPTEATIWATYARIDRAPAVGAMVPIGRPIDGLSTLVVDAGIRPVPIGVAGELCLAGIGVATGYLGDPETTARHFAQRGEAMTYRTGDLVRQSHDGMLYFLGRIDRQVKVRGLRIEPEEIEQCLRSHPAVAEAIVVAHDTGDGTTLVAYLYGAVTDTGTVDACRDLVRAHLPAHMMPSYFVVLQSVPRTTSGKIDYRALPPPTASEPHETAAREPATPTERQVAMLVANIVRRPRVGPSESFFHVGGHSLTAAQLAARIRIELKVPAFGIRDVFLHPTVAGLAARVDALVTEAAEPDEPDVPLVRLPRRHEAADTQKVPEWR